MNCKRLIVISTIGVIALVGCSQSQPSATQPPASSTSATTTQIAEQPDAQALLDVVSKTRTAVEAGDFAKAQKEFNQFEEHWSQVEDGIKAKSSEVYSAIEDDMDSVMNTLNSSRPNQDDALKALQFLEDNIRSVTKS